MRLLLDTHVLLWWLAGHPSLSRAATAEIRRGADVFVSAATAWEIAIKQALGKLEGPADVIAEVETEQFRALPITLRHAVTAGALPRHHADPFDRMLVAQAQVEDLTLVTSDQQLHRYAVQVLDAS